MGLVVTTNSSTLVNKGLEVIEAHLLFDVPYDRIEVTVHPQSIVHSMVEFVDGSTIAQASPPDMRLPISLGLDWPHRVPGVGAPLDWTTASSWDFAPLDDDAFPAVRLAKRVGEAGATFPAVFNAANEQAGGGVPRRPHPVARHRRHHRTGRRGPRPRADVARRGARGRAMGPRGGGRHTGSMTFPGRRARFLAILPVAGLLLAMQVVTPAAACACGAPAPRPGDDVIVDKEHAILSWDGEQERIELLLDMLTDADDVGLIFPTPSPAEVTAGDRQTFIDIETAILPKQVTVDDWWAGDQGDGAAGGAAPPVVLDQVQLGPVEATTLEASDADGLTAWLDENGYEIRDEIAAGLEDYVERGWYFVALKLTSDVPLEGGARPDPVHVRQR